MNRNEIYSLIRTGEKDYSLRTLFLPREEIQEMREQESDVQDNLEKMVSQLPVVDAGMKGRTNFILPDNGKLRFWGMDNGRDFAKRVQFNRTDCHGTQEEVMAQLLDKLRERGYQPRPNACFRNVDILGTLQKIMEHNTEYHQTDFRHDREMLLDAMEKEGLPKYFFWLTRRNGTHCYREEDVYMKGTSPYNAWNANGNLTDGHPMAFLLELQNRTENGVRGNIFEIDYQKHLDYLSTHSIPPVCVDILFRNRFGYRTFGFEDYAENWENIVREYGRAEKIRYVAGDFEALTDTVLKARWMFFEDAKEMGVGDYIKEIEKERLHGYGYTADDLLLTGPLDAEKAIQYGLECFMLEQDNSKERLTDLRAYEWAVSRRKLFGMLASEKAILKYFKQDAQPLFTEGEMQKIHALVLQAGMRNEPEENGLLGSILRKTECVLSGGICQDIQEKIPGMLAQEGWQGEMEP